MQPSEPKPIAPRGKPLKLTDYAKLNEAGEVVITIAEVNQAIEQSDRSIKPFVEARSQW